MTAQPNAVTVTLPDRPLTDGDYERIRQIVREEIEARDEVLDTEGACHELKTSETSLWRLVREDGLPVIRLNATNRYLRSDLLAYARAHRVVFDGGEWTAAADWQVA